MSEKNIKEFLQTILTDFLEIFNFQLNYQNSAKMCLLKHCKCSAQHFIQFSALSGLESIMIYMDCNLIKGFD